MNYGFVIDNRKCIGCHACSTACKSENEVPLGVNRTWVKTVDHGQYPNVTRSFQVTRCNHCENPPCARICPVTAMYQRDDGIVEFDPNICIGCKACMQACPYDAIYIDPESQTAAKCHMCSHRVDIGLEPACVVLCPEHAIVFGDMDDPGSEISQVLSKHHTTVRKPEQGTAPKLFYVDGDDVVLHPTVMGEAQPSYAAADVITEQGGSPRQERPRETGTAASGAKIRLPIVQQGVPTRGPITMGSAVKPLTRQGRMAEHMVQVTYNAQHKVPWHWPVPAYLLTKGIGAGIFLFLALGWGLGLFAFDALTMVVGGLIGLIALGVTTGLLVYDLEQPKRFLSILLHPQWRSWLTRGAFILVGFSLVGGAWWAAEGAGYLGLWSMPSALRQGLLWLSVPFAVGAAVYTAFLFAQAEGRDLWQSPLLPFHLVVQSIYLGTGTLLVAGALLGLPAAMLGVAKITFAAALIVDLFITLAGELGVPHASEVAARAAHEISHGRYKNTFWWGAIALGHAVPLALMLPTAPIAGALAGILAAIGLYLYEHAFVMAPQEVPNS
jgi:Fe-S-cluster-containing dehydrogenase component/formate-dependent nitrite reductase membrane component NrfD